LTGFIARSTLLATASTQRFGFWLMLRFRSVAHTGNAERQNDFYLIDGSFEEQSLKHAGWTPY